MRRLLSAAGLGLEAELDPSLPYTVSDEVTLRPEPFGALAYHYGNRRLTFLKSLELVAVLSQLRSGNTVDEALAQVGVSERRRRPLLRALQSLLAADMLRAGPKSPQKTLLRPSHPPSDPHTVSVPDQTDQTQRVPTTASVGLTDRLAHGLQAPICLTWELTYACNLACVHCLSSSGRRDPAELSTAECRQFIDEMAKLGVFYVNIGGGEPTIRKDFDELVAYAVDRGVGVKFSTNGTTMTPERANRLAATDYVDVQISVDGADTTTNDIVRGDGSFSAAKAAMDNLASAGFEGFKISVVVTRSNVSQLDQMLALAESYRAQLRLTRLRPAGRGAQVWDQLHPTQEQQRQVHSWLLGHREVLTGDSFFHLSALGEALPGLNLCGAGRVVCLVDPVGDVYACPFVMHQDFKAGSVRGPGGFSSVWKTSDLFDDLRRPSESGACNACGSYDTCHGGCMAAKFFTGLALDDPDPECVLGHGETALEAVGKVDRPTAGAGHSRVTTGNARVTLGHTRSRSAGSSFTIR